MTIGQLMRLMSDGKVHSGEQLGNALGVSRAAVWKQLKRLVAMGVEVEAVKGSGYRLVEPIQPLDGAAIVAGLPADARHLLCHLFVHDELDSTNAFIAGRFKQAAGHGEVCLAETQTAGRGRRGRGWSTPWGQGLLLSVGWRFEGGIAALEGVSLAVGVAVAQVLEAYGATPGLKWPNDILSGNAGEVPAKLAGILVEVTGDTEGPCDAVVGLGMNLFMSEQDRATIDQPVATLMELSAQGEISRNQLASDVIAALLNLLAGFEGKGFSAWQQDWNARHAWAGEPIRVIQGSHVSNAIALDVDARGNLWVQDETGRRALSGGEISIRRPS